APTTRRTPTRRRASTRPTRSCSSGWQRRWASTGRASARRTTRSSRSSALAGTATSGGRGCPARTPELPPPPSGRGSGNVISLDVLRALTRTPRALEVFIDELRVAEGADARLDARVRELESQFVDPHTLETRARRVVESMALCLQGSLLVRHAPPAVADAFCASRLAGDGGFEYGTLPAGTDFEGIIARSRPQA